MDEVDGTGHARGKKTLLKPRLKGPSLFSSCQNVATQEEDSVLELLIFQEKLKFKMYSNVKSPSSVDNDLTLGQSISMGRI